MSLLDPYGRPLPPQPRRNGQDLTTIDAIFRHELGGRTTTSGRPAELVSWFYSCLTQTARGLSQMPLKLWRPDAIRRGAKPGFRQVFGHKLQPRLDRPHPQMSSIAWQEQWVAILLDGGDVFCIPDEQPGVDGITRALHLYGRSQVFPLRDGVNGPLIAWQLRRAPTEAPKILTLDKVMHWRLLNPYDTVMGLAPKDCLRMALDGDYAKTIYDRSFYENAANPSAVLMNKSQELDEPQRAEIRQSFEEFHAGPTKAGRLLILGSDWEFKQWALQQSQAQFIESRKLAREEVAAAFFGFPVEFLNAQEAGGLSRAGEQVARLKLYENCVFPLARLFEPEFNSGFIQRVDPRLQIAFDTRQVPVALEYAKAESDIFKTYVANGIAVNELIEVMDLPFDPQVGGDVAMIMNTFIPLDSVSPVQPAINVTPGADGTLGVAGSQPKALAESAPDPTITAALPSAEHRAVDPLAAVVERLRTKLKRLLYGIRQAALRDPERAEQGATPEERRQWVRAIVVPLAVATEAGADATVLAGHSPSEIHAMLARLQEQAASLRFADPRREAACEATAGQLIDFLDDTLRDAARSQDPKRYLASLDRAAALLADRSVRQAVTAGAATMMEAA